MFSVLNTSPSPPPQLEIIRPLLYSAKSPFCYSCCCVLADSCWDTCKSRLWLSMLIISHLLYQPLIFLSFFFFNLSWTSCLNCVRLTSFYLAEYPSSLPQVKRTDMTFKLRNDFKLGKTKWKRFLIRILPRETHEPKALVLHFGPWTAALTGRCWGGRVAPGPGWLASKKRQRRNLEPEVRMELQTLAH